MAMQPTRPLEPTIFRSPPVEFLQKFSHYSTLNMGECVRWVRRGASGTRQASLNRAGPLIEASVPAGSCCQGAAERSRSPHRA